MDVRKAALIGVVVAVSVIADQVTKVIARDALQGQPTQSFLGDTFRLTFIENHGAFLGMGGSLPPMARTAIFTVFVSLLLVGFLVWIWRTPALSRLTIVAAALIIGGGIGNLIDRITNNGGVADFLNMGIGSLRTGIFNVADVWIVIGAGLLLISGDLKDEDAEDSPADADSAADDAADG